MSLSSNDRVRPQVLEADEDAFLSLKLISGYQPVNPAYTVATLTSQYEAQRTAQQAELAAQNALAAARDTAVAVEWEFHEAMLGVKTQVIAQFGPNSDEVAALGLKKKSKRKSPSHHQPPA